MTSLNWRMLTVTKVNSSSDIIDIIDMYKIVKTDYTVSNLNKYYREATKLEQLLYA